MGTGERIGVFFPYSSTQHTTLPQESSTGFGTERASKLLGKWHLKVVRAWIFTRENSLDVVYYSLWSLPTLSAPIFSLFAILPSASRLSPYRKSTREFNYPLVHWMKLLCTGEKHGREYKNSHTSQ